ncbi:MAG: sensor histidine kinase, partial [Acidimicrobiales bacterium]
MTLRRRLVAVQLALVTVGLLAFGVFSYALYGASLRSNLDSELQSVTPLLASSISHQLPGSAQGGGGSGAFGAPPGDGGPEGPPEGAPHNLPEGSFVQLRGPTGVTVVSQKVPCYTARCPEPELPVDLDATTTGRYFSVPATDGSTGFQVFVQQLAEQFQWCPGGDVLVTALPLTNEHSSLHKLLILELSIGGAVLVALSAAGLLVVRRGLRPLERMAGTARAIAAGDLSRRASPADGRGEVGQLGQAFNTMMASIEGAFAARDATEGRLRQFLADASHELRTPLTSIRGYAELYRMGAASDPEELQRVMSRIEDNAHEMGDLVEELLLLARLDQTRRTDPGEVDLVVVAAEVLDDAGVSARGRRLRLEAPEPVIVVGDPSHLRRAVANLVSNAVRHTPDGSAVEISVAAEPGAAVLAVRDHGPGLSGEGLEHAFDRFWRADPGRTGGGAGLGLAIVAAVAAEHGGEARARNAEGGGAAFELRLPLAPSV